MGRDESLSAGENLPDIFRLLVPELGELPFFLEMVVAGTSEFFVGERVTRKGRSIDASRFMRLIRTEQSDSTRKRS